MVKYKKAYINSFIILLLVITIVITSLYWMAYIPRKVINLNTNQVATVHVFQMGKSVDITDRIIIDEIVDNLIEVVFQRTSFDNLLRGSDLSVSFYNYNNEKINSFSFINETTMTHNGFFFKARSGLIDYDKLINYLPE